MKRTILFLILLAAGSLFGQRKSEIEGRISDQQTGAPIPYANIYNQATGNGTISNEDGYFRLAIDGLHDSIVVSFIGYENKVIRLRANVGFYPVELKESAQLLSEIVVRPKDDAFLFDLIGECRNNRTRRRHSSKAYYELKSYHNDQQMELVEGYYNTAIAGYDLAGLELKAGRLALQPYENRFFVSLESSKAITLSALGERTGYFPDSPVSLNKRRASKHFYLSLDKKYLNGDGDSIYVIDYQPQKSGTGLFFHGKIWINKTDKQFLKITQQCDHCEQHPFLPLFDSDSIRNVSFHITKSFTPYQDEMIFNHTDFTYVIDYKSRAGALNEKMYSVKAQAVLYAYDFDQPFFLPIFDFENIIASDYRKINAMPYNEFFWANHDEYSLNDRKRLNELFFSHPNSLTNLELFQSDKQRKKGFFEQPFVRWSKERVSFREVVPDSADDVTSASFQADKYHLAVKIFLDINTYNDSTHILTATVFDPYESYSYLPPDAKTHCFINTFFDLCEVERLQLQAKLERVKDSPSRMEKVYNQFLPDFEQTQKAYLDETQRGTNEEAMIKWNLYVAEHLGINNLELFDPFGRGGG